LKICDNFFSGFCFVNEYELFNNYLQKSDFIISGFSYGAIKAFKKALKSNIRVDKLQLLSPAFFQTKDKKFKKTQLVFFKKDKDKYIENFLQNVKYPDNKEIEKYFKEGSFEELEELLNYVWLENELEKLIQKDVKIEVFLGEKDLIIDSNKAKEFFKEFATVYYFKNKGHLL